MSCRVGLQRALELSVSSMRTGSVKPADRCKVPDLFVALSVSSMRTGSVKPWCPSCRAGSKLTFSVLDADRFGETPCRLSGSMRTVTFSVLDADRFGETRWKHSSRIYTRTFSVLDADRFGETQSAPKPTSNPANFQCPRCGPVR